MADKIAKVQQETFNPFTPEFGKVPAYFAGREQVLSDILSTFEGAGGYYHGSFGCHFCAPR